MNIQEEHQNYKHFEAWVAEFLQIDADHAALSLPVLVQVYANTYPGRTNRLLADLVQVARRWTVVQNDEMQIKETHP